MLLPSILGCSQQYLQIKKIGIHVEKKRREGIKGGKTKT